MALFHPFSLKGSLAKSAFMINTDFKFELNLRISEFQTSVHRLLVFLTIADILTAFGYILGTTYYLLLDPKKKNLSDPVCVAQSFITTFSSLASFAWTSIIAVHLYLLIRKQTNFQRSRIIEGLYHCLGWTYLVF